MARVGKTESLKEVCRGGKHAHEGNGGDVWGATRSLSWAPADLQDTSTWVCNRNFKLTSPKCSPAPHSCSQPAPPCQQTLPPHTASTPKSRPQFLFFPRSPPSSFSKSSWFSLKNLFGTYPPLGNFTANTHTSTIPRPAHLQPIHVHARLAYLNAQCSVFSMLHTWRRLSKYSQTNG